MNHFRRGFAIELIKLSANAQENEIPDAYDGSAAVGNSMAKKKGTGVPSATPFGKSKNAPAALTSPMGMRGYVGESV